MNNSHGGKIQWYISRLKAMSASEVMWRVGQKGRAAAERVRFGHAQRTVDSPLYRAARNLHFDPAPLGLVVDSQHAIDTDHAIALPGGYSYADFATDWHAGFQTQGHWPLQWSYDIDLKGRDDIGDARTNWELNRHGQLVLLAKAYYLTADASHLHELSRLLDSWVAENPFLWGISWTSAMEMAVRAINWLYAAAFLHESLGEVPSELAERLIRRLTAGAANMGAYISKHYSRGSSANNHLLVEMSALWLIGACCGHERWCSTALHELLRQIPLQFTPDGVDREMSLHYHAFAMEAYLLVAHGLQATGRAVSAEMADILQKAAEFVAHSCVDGVDRCVFGDDDNGHILNFSAKPADYYTYILQFTALAIGGQRYSAMQPVNPTLAWLYSDKAIEAASHLPLYDSTVSRTFVEGGYTFLRRADITVAMDHGPLGFGSIAAHGHADALSIQLWAGGQQILGDPGTYIYNIRRDLRDQLRTTAMHNTVTVNGREQAEILGPFLWGQRATTMLREASASTVTASTQSGEGEPAHTRSVSIIDGHTVVIEDSFSAPCRWDASFIVPPELSARVSGNEATIGEVATITVEGSDRGFSLDRVPYSALYGSLDTATWLRAAGSSLRVTYTIKILSNPKTSAL